MVPRRPRFGVPAALFPSLSIPARAALAVGLVWAWLVPPSVEAGAISTLIDPTGAAASDEFGSFVGTAGDVNGDGYADVIVGAPLNDAAGFDVGRAYVYYGGPAADDVADFTLTGSSVAEQFGISVGSAGDVNGDGYADVIVGAWFNNAGGSHAGRAYVYYLGPGFDAAPDLVLTGAAAGDLFGFWVGTAGDVNGDGYSDVIVGATGNDTGGTTAGQAYVFYGGPIADAVADLTFTGLAPFDMFGGSVGTAGDVNGDGFADVIVGAQNHDAAGTDAGQAYVFHGGPGADALPDFVVTGAAPGDNFGRSVATAGDVNGDGYADVIVGAYLNNAGGVDAGRTYVYHGGPGADAVADLVLTGAAASDFFGYSVGTAGDVNGDGFADVIVGAYNSDAVGADAGRAYLYYGGPGADAVADIVLVGEAGGDNFGRSVGTAGDASGDGFADVIVGAYHNDAGGVDAGRAYVMTNALFGPRTDYVTGSDPRSLEIGDLNGDAKADLAVACFSAGEISVLLGNGDGTFGPKAQFGTGGDATSVAIGDLNSDGRRDLAASNLSGLASVMLGNGDGTFGPATLYTTGGGGSNAIVAGDWDGSGTLDVVVANSFSNMISALLGNGSGGLGAPIETPSGEFPISVSVADFNADSRRDLAVANRSSNTIWVFFGNGNGTFSLVWVGEAALFPYSVAVGDLNGDTFSDLVAANNGVGSVSVFLGLGGGSFGPKTDFATGFGPKSVAIGDVDGDGLNDLAVANSGANTVSVLLGFGNGTFAPKMDFATAFSPSSVAIGDLNGDGRRDLVVTNEGSSSVSVLLNQGGAASGDLPPVVVAPVSANVEAAGDLNVSVSASDPDGDAITSMTADLSALPPGNDAVLTPNGANIWTLAWHPALGDAGSYVVTFTAAAFNGVTGSAEMLIDVAPVGTNITGRFVWTPGSSDVGMFDVTFRAADEFGQTATAVTHITVTDPAGGGGAPSLIRNVALAPTIPTKGPVIQAKTNVEATVGSTLVVDVSASGGADTLETDTTDLPAENDATFATDLEPAVTAPSTATGEPGSQITISVTASDPEGDAITSLTVDLASLPQGHNAVFTPNASNTAGTFTWTPTAADTGNYGVTFKASNALVSVAPTFISVGRKLSAYWKLNGNGADAAGSNPLNPAGGVSYAPGRIDLAADLDGSAAGRLQAPAMERYDFAPTGFTAECWVRPRSLAFSPDPRIAHASGAGGVEAWELFVCGSSCLAGNVGVRIYQSGPSGPVTQLVSTGSIFDGQFHHVAATYDGATLMLYVDGLLNNSLSIAGLAAQVGGGTFILGDDAGGTGRFDGLVDEVRIWRVARTEAQIQASMNSELLPTAVEMEEGPRFAYALFQNRPNPFNPSTVIRFELAEACRARLDVYDVRGRLITRLIDRELPAGRHSVPWPGRESGGPSVASGVYFYSLTAGGFTGTRRMVLLR